MGDFTEELVHSIALAKGKGKCVGRVQDSIEKATAPGSCCHLGTRSAAQEGPIVKGLADGNVEVIGHFEYFAVMKKRKKKTCAAHPA